MNRHATHEADKNVMGAWRVFAGSKEQSVHEKTRRFWLIPDGHSVSFYSGSIASLVAI
jgi:hypothetical protein